MSFRAMGLTGSIGRRRGGRLGHCRMGRGCEGCCYSTLRNFARSYLAYDMGVE